MKFYLGTHMPHWLRFSEVPLFVSHRRLARDKGVPVANCDWALDSGGFTELSMYGEWRTTEDDYLAAVRRYRDEIGRMEWAAPQDWMCEPFMIAKTSKTLAEHQWPTVQNFLELRMRAPDLPIVPVLQGWEVDDYQRCVDLYERMGVDLGAELVVGVGSVCRRQSTAEITGVFTALAEHRLNLHGFGVKGGGLRAYGHLLGSADSMAWSYRGRRIRPCPHRGVTSCANCFDHALEWRKRALRS